ncbi:MAG: hypothetical protein Q9216_001780 [Gyalolechia sp. 2 TL-2023]
MTANSTIQAEIDTMSQPGSSDPSCQNGPCSLLPGPQSIAVSQSQPKMQIPSTTFEFVQRVPSCKSRPEQRWYIPAQGPLDSMREQTGQTEKNVETYREWQLRTQHGLKSGSSRNLWRNLRRKNQKANSIKPVPPAFPRKTFSDQPLHMPAKRRMFDLMDEISIVKKARKSDLECGDQIKLKIDNSNESCANIVPPAISRKSYPDPPLYVPVKRRQLNDAKAQDIEKDKGSNPQSQPQTDAGNHKGNASHVGWRGPLVSDRLLANDDTSNCEDSAGTTSPQPIQIINSNQSNNVSTAVAKPADSIKSMEKSKQISEQPSGKPQPARAGKCKGRKGKSWRKNNASQVKPRNNTADPAAWTNASQTQKQGGPISSKHEGSIRESVPGTVAGLVATEHQPTSLKHGKVATEAMPGTIAGSVTAKPQPTSSKRKKGVSEAVPGSAAGTIATERNSHNQADNKAADGTTLKQKRTWVKQKKFFPNKQANAKTKKAKEDAGQVDVSLTRQDHNSGQCDRMHNCQHHQPHNQNTAKATILTQPINVKKSQPEGERIKTNDMPPAGFIQGGKYAQELSSHATNLSMRSRVTERAKPEVPSFLKENRPVATQFPNIVHGQPARSPVSIAKDTTSGDYQALANSKRQLGTDPKKPAGTYVRSPLHASKPHLLSAAQSPKDHNTRTDSMASGNRNQQASRSQRKGSKNPVIPTAMNPNEPGPMGNWNWTDSWAKPHRIKRPAPESTYDIDFSSRPRNDIVVRIAHTVIDRNGKEVVQTAVDPANKEEFPDLQTAVESAQQWMPPHKRGGAKYEQEISAQRQYPLKGHEAESQSTPMISEEKAESNAIKDDAVSSPLVTSRADLTSYVASSNIIQISPPTHDQSSAPKPTGIRRYFQPLKPAQIEHPKQHTPTPPLPPPDPVASPLQEAAPGHLITEGSLFLTYIGKSGALTAPQKTSPNNDLSAKAALPEPNTRSPVQVTMVQNEFKQQWAGKDASARDSTSTVDEIVAGIKAKTIARPRSSRDSSNQSVRGRKNSKLGAISVNLSFEETFKGRNASAISEESVVLYVGRRPPNPYQTNDHLGDYEPGQLRGWDGNWAPAPVEWDIRDMYDYRKPEHQRSIKNFVVDRYLSYNNGGCAALKIDEEQFTSGASLATGLGHFGKPIDAVYHHHLRAQDPYTLNKLHQTAEQSRKIFVRGHERIFGPTEKKRVKKLTEAEMQANQKKHEALIASIPPNKFIPISNIYIRPARAVDLPQIRRIHSEWVRLSVVTSERVELTDAQWRIRFDDCAEERFPFIVAILRNGHTAEPTERIVGFAYAEDFGGERSMWRYTCELQFYTDPSYLRKGIGKNLVDVVLRGLDNFYVYHDAVPFVYSQDELNRHDSGGSRRLKNVMVSFPFKETEQEQSKWIWDWLARVFDFEVQANLKGIGRKSDDVDEP